jgi:hypothetical protein
MKFRMIVALCALAAGWALGEGRASAQSSWQLGTYTPPQVRRSAGSRGFGQLQGGLTSLQDTSPVVNQGGLNVAGPLQTGHPAGYMNYQRFFPLSYGTSTSMIGTPGVAGIPPGLVAGAPGVAGVAPGMMTGTPGMAPGMMTGTPFLGASPISGGPTVGPFFPGVLNRSLFR